MKKFFFLLFLSSTLIFSRNSNISQKDSLLYNEALELSKKILLVDSHIDLPFRLKNNWQDISVNTKSGHMDYPRAVKGGLNAAFMSIFIPARYEETGGSVELADTLIDIVEKISSDHPDKFALAYNTHDVKRNFENGLISLPMGIENGTPIQGSFENLKHFYDRGIRYITLSHGKANHICDSSYDPNKKWNGLSSFGETLIPEMNKLGIMVDISHVSDSTFYQVLKLTKVPVIASHSSCRYYTPGFERNMSDDMIKKLAENGGLIQITFGSYFISGDYQSKMKQMEKELKQHNWNRWSVEGKNYFKNFVKENNLDFGAAENIAEHIDHVVKLVGIDFVGLGSDFDGIDALPKGINDVSSYPNIIYELLKKGYSENDIAKICSGNLLRVWKEVEELSEKY